jgi:hypothetical protein
MRLRQQSQHIFTHQIPGKPGKQRIHLNVTSTWQRSTPFDNSPTTASKAAVFRLSSATTPRNSCGLHFFRDQFL